jgi:hypothetical protein
MFDVLLLLLEELIFQSKNYWILEILSILLHLKWQKYSWKTCFNAYKISITQELPGTSSYTSRYRRTAKIFKTPPFIYSNILENHTHSYISVENPHPIIYFITILWPVFIYIPISLKILSLCICTLFFTLVSPNWQIKYSILFYSI